MSKSKPNGEAPEPDPERRAGRREVNPPYSPHLAQGVHRFRRFIAELIARRISAARRRLPGVEEDPKE
jgi:hypothetical protein